MPYGKESAKHGDKYAVVRQVALDLYAAIRIGEAVEVLTKLLTLFEREGIGKNEVDVLRNFSVGEFLLPIILFRNFYKA